MIGKTILLAESDPETIKALSLRLKSENYELLVSSDALQGTRSVLENKPDLVIANAQVPGGGASAIHKQLQSRGDFTTPVVYLANCPDAALRSQADTMGAASFHTKPFDLDEILQEIHRILKNPAEAARVVGDKRTMRILIVDDEEEHCDLIEGCLQTEGSEPWELTRVHTVADACRILENDRFDCVLLDHNLPDGHGCDVLHERESLLLTTPVIGLSTSQDPDVAIAEFRGGCVDFLPKREAFKGHILRQRIMEALAKSNRRAIATVMERRQLGMAVEDTQNDIIRSARMDALMEIWNRGAFDDYHADLNDRTAKSGGIYVVFMADVDNFKKYNDTYGHTAGDDVLKAVAGALKQTLRDHDFLARYGGEELVVLCEKAEPKIAPRIAERLRSSIWNLDIPHEQNAAHGRVTISLGAAFFDATLPESPTELLIRADAALYEAKEQGGRNTFKFAQPKGALEKTNA